MIESHRGTGERAARELEAAGHSVVRCFDDGSASFPCRGLTNAEECPTNQPADVALLVRPGVNPRPTGYEAGIQCALRAGIPVVEDGTAILDPYADWIQRRVRHDVVGACEAAVVAFDEEIIGEIRGHIDVILERLGIDPEEVAVRLDRIGRFHVILEGPPIGPQDEQLLSVRVSDAIRDSVRPIGPIDVSYAPR